MSRRSGWSERIAGNLVADKLIYFWKKDQWECYDLVADPQEMHNIYNAPKARKIVAILKQKLWRLKKELKDDDQFADRQSQDSSYVEAPPPKKP